MSILLIIKFFCKELKLVQNIYKEDRLRRLKGEVKPFRFSWIDNFDEKMQKKLLEGLTAETAKEQIAQEYTKELFIKELNELLETNFQIKDYKQSIDIYIDQKNLNLSFFDKPIFGKLADLAEIQKENQRLAKGIFNHLGLMFILCLPTFLGWGFIWLIQYLIKRFKNKNLTKLAKNLDKKEILSDTENWRQEIFENTLNQIDEFILNNLTTGQK